MSAFSPGMPRRCSADDMAFPEHRRTACVTVAVSTMNRPSRLARCVTAIVAGFAGAERPNAVTGRILPLGSDRPGFHAMSTLTRCVRTVHRGRFLPWTVGSGANTAVQRGWLERLGGFDERLGAGSAGQSAEDVDLLYRLLCAGSTLRFQPDAIVSHEPTDSAGRGASAP